MKKILWNERAELPLNHELKTILNNSEDSLMIFDAKNLYPSARTDPESIYPKIETGYALKREAMEYDLIMKFN